MAKTVYCWRCKTELPMLDEQEWAELSQCMTDEIRDVQAYRQTHAATLEEASHVFKGQAALDRYFEITGIRERDVHNIWHHRLSLLGPPCEACGKPLRTPQAKLCAACGAHPSSLLP